METAEQRAARHKRAMQRKKEHVDQRIAAAMSVCLFAPKCRPKFPLRPFP